MVSLCILEEQTTRRKKDGTTYRTYKLVECTRIGDKVVQHTLMHLASDFTIPRKMRIPLSLDT